MNEELALDGHTPPNRAMRIWILLALVLTVTMGHWWTPRGDEYFRAIHVVLRKLYFLPVVIAAIWFNLRGGIFTAALITFLYSLHVILQWGGKTFENINQLGEIGSIWIFAMVSGRLVQSEKRALREVAETHEGSLVALVAALDAREHETELHSLRVRAYALRIGRELGMDRKEMRVLAQAALLHDVGKIGTPDRVLLKQGRLDDEEWGIMQQHPEVGRRVLSSVLFLRNAAEIVYSHHEKYDGSGYPLKLQGRQIPFLSRVFAVADVFDALTSDRPYHKKLTWEEAKKEIRKQSGRHFDPEVSDAFFRISCLEWNRIATQVMERARFFTSSRKEHPIEVTRSTGGNLR